VSARVLKGRASNRAERVELLHVGQKLNRHDEEHAAKGQNASSAIFFLTPCPRPPWRIVAPRQSGWRMGAPPQRCRDFAGASERPRAHRHPEPACVASRGCGSWARPAPAESSSRVSKRGLCAKAVVVPADAEQARIRGSDAALGAALERAVVGTGRMVMQRWRRFGRTHPHCGHASADARPALSSRFLQHIATDRREGGTRYLRITIPSPHTAAAVCRRARLASQRSPWS